MTLRRRLWLSVPALCVLCAATLIAHAAPRAARTRLWYSSEPGRLWVIASSANHTRSYSVSASSFHAHVGQQALLLRFDRERRVLRLVTPASTAVRAFGQAEWAGDSGLKTLAPSLLADSRLIRGAVALRPELEPVARAIELALGTSLSGTPTSGAASDLTLLDAAFARAPQDVTTATLHLTFDHERARAEAALAIAQASAAAAPERP